MIEIHRELLREAEIILREIHENKIRIKVFAPNLLKVEGVLTEETKSQIRLRKAQIIEILSPKCRYCEIALEPLDKATEEQIWFCPMGCQTVTPK